MRYFVINYSYLVLFELLFKIFVMQTYDIGFLYIFIFSLPISLSLCFLAHMTKKRGINRLISIIINIIIFFIFGAETIYYSFYKTICGLSALMYGGQVMEFYSAIINHLFANIFLIGSYAILLIIMLVLSIKKFSYERTTLRDNGPVILASLALIISSFEIITPHDESAKSLFYEMNDIMQTTNRFGAMSAILSDAYKTLTGFEENVEFTSKPAFTKDDETEYNMTNIDFDDLIAKEDDNTIKSMHAYFSSIMPTEQNEYTGLFAGKNVIFMVAEGFYPIAVDEELTPTLYKLVNSSFIFKNYYQPIYNCSTSDGEFISSLSILPGVATCSMKKTSDVYLPYSLGNIMKNYGYDTYAFHGWTYTYYGRDQTLPNLGYTYYGYDRYKKGYKYALKNIHDSWPTSDVDVMNASYDIYHNSKNFIAYYMTISGHLEYNFTGGNAMSLKNKAAVSGLDANNNIKAYIASQIEFDKSLAILLDNLKRDGILDDTVIVITADHYPYGLSEQDIASYVDWLKNPNFDLYKNNLIIYNSQIEDQEVMKYTSSLDILPTILNLLGVKFDSRLLIGRDIFSDAADLVIFNNKSWITDKGRYDYLKKKFEPFNGEEVSKEYISDINEIVKQKFQMSKLLISKDYYRLVLGG